MSSLDPYQAATLIWWCANQYGVCRDVPVTIPHPAPLEPARTQPALFTIEAP